MSPPFAIVRWEEQRRLILSSPDLDFFALGFSHLPLLPAISPLSRKVPPLSSPLSTLHALSTSYHLELIYRSHCRPSPRDAYLPC
eukprot:scaffold26658_cov153-Skeletonema_menzelii.AAC.4